MPLHFDLIITADYPSRTAEFRLHDAADVQIAYRKTDFKTISISHQQGLFDLRNFLRLYVEEGKERAAVAEIGVCIAEEVLGAEIFAKLWESTSQRIDPRASAKIKSTRSGSSAASSIGVEAEAFMSWTTRTRRLRSPRVSAPAFGVAISHGTRASAAAR